MFTNSSAVWAVLVLGATVVEVPGVREASASRKARWAAVAAASSAAAAS